MDITAQKEIEKGFFGIHILVGVEVWQKYGGYTLHNFSYCIKLIIGS